MNFDFSEEQEMLRGEVRRFLADKSTSTVVRGVLESEQQHDAALWQAIGALGWAGVAIPEEFGGLGLGYLELCVIAEELGRALAPVPFASSIYLAAEALLQFGSDDQKRAWLPKLAAGEAIGALALAEGTGSPSWSRLQVAASGSGDACRINGTKWPVLDGLAADIAIVAANGGDGFGLYLVELDQPGVARVVEPGIDDSRKLARLTFTDAAAQKLAGGEAALQTLLNRAAVLFSFEQLGGADAALAMGVAYAKERFAFGRAIGSFQAIKHKLADLFSELELARSNCYYAAWALSTNDASLDEAAAVAMIGVTRAYFNCAKENIQVHGGMGFTWDLDGHLHYRRSRLMGGIIGGPARWREQLIRVLERSNSVAA
ncbi:MAG: acyl-CoA/acyl-ACP dehydrogenase [Sphingomonas sp.]|uniref:acyl-CoA dehydrogenase family protein n=1 Tax=Sphingomonas sp. TaxID=28214 RepID=UPI0035A850E8|nr:acyl-CoA/acyl-ACP dehydrogenase [Sphingomonas sp.]